MKHINQSELDLASRVQSHSYLWLEGETPPESQHKRESDLCATIFSGIFENEDFISKEIKHAVDVLRKLGRATVPDLKEASGLDVKFLGRFMMLLLKQGAVEIVDYERKKIKKRIWKYPVYLLSEQYRIDVKPKATRLTPQLLDAHKKDLQMNTDNHFYHPLLRTKPSPINWPSEMTRTHIMRDDNL